MKAISGMFLSDVHSCFRVFSCLSFSSVRFVGSIVVAFRHSSFSAFKRDLLRQTVRSFEALRSSQGREFRPISFLVDLLHAILMNVTPSECSNDANTKAESESELNSTADADAQQVKLWTESTASASSSADGELIPRALVRHLIRNLIHLDSGRRPNHSQRRT